MFTNYHPAGDHPLGGEFLRIYEFGKGRNRDKKLNLINASIPPG
jgi:hypothetical protein